MTTNRDKFQDECAVVGVYGHPEAAKMTYLALYALQHRGQESTGIVSSDGIEVYAQKGMGLVSQFFTETRLDVLKGHIAIGHNRYSTNGSSTYENAQPITRTLFCGITSVAHNGNITNATELRKQLQERSHNFISTSDTELFLLLLQEKRQQTFLESLEEALKEVRGAFSLVLLREETLTVMRDPYGFRPLVLGKFSLDGAYIVASETCALDLVGAEYIRDIKPGEILHFTPTRMTSLISESQPLHQCIFELVYLSRPDSVTFGKNVYLTRKEFGKQLAKEHPVNADFVLPVPDSGLGAALGYAEESKIPFELGITRNHYVGRTFIEPNQEIRDFGVKIKLNPIKSLLQGKKIVLVDDSLVRGTTSKKIISLLRNIGVLEIHFRVSSPPTIGPCLYGIDTPNKEELIASSSTIEEIRQYIGADTLGYLSHEGMLEVMKSNKSQYCTSCFTGKYVV